MLAGCNKPSIGTVKDWERASALDRTGGSRFPGHGLCDRPITFAPPSKALRTERQRLDSSLLNPPNLSNSRAQLRNHPKSIITRTDSEARAFRKNVADAPQLLDRVTEPSRSSTQHRDVKRRPVPVRPRAIAGGYPDDQ